MKYIIVLFVFVLGLFCQNCVAQSNTFYIPPISTDINYAETQDSHMIVKNSSLHNDKLFVFLGGTGSSTTSYRRISEFAADIGFDVINLSYPNTVAAASLRNASDNLAFDKYRQEICYGTTISDFVTVDSLNSIHTRAVKLLNYLHEIYPDQLWNQYLLDSNELDWSKIIISGHSQGAGHASYLAKFNQAERVIMFSGPNDYSDHFDRPANWLRLPSETPIQNHFSYLSLLDEVVDFDKQFSILKDLKIYPQYDSIHVDAKLSPYNNSHILYTTQSPGIALLNHNATMRFSLTNNTVWEYMLTTDVSTNVGDLYSDNELLIYPNPMHTFLSIDLKGNKFQDNYQIYNLNGQLVLSGGIIGSTIQEIDVSSLENGIYYLSVNGGAYKIVKQ